MSRDVARRPDERRSVRAFRPQDGALPLKAPYMPPRALAPWVKSAVRTPPIPHPAIEETSMPIIGSSVRTRMLRLRDKVSGKAAREDRHDHNHRLVRAVAPDAVRAIRIVDRGGDERVLVAILLDDATEAKPLTPEFERSLIGDAALRGVRFEVVTVGSEAGIRYDAAVSLFPGCCRSREDGGQSSALLGRMETTVPWPAAHRRGTPSSTEKTSHRTTDWVRPAAMIAALATSSVPTAGRA